VSASLHGQIDGAVAELLAAHVARSTPRLARARPNVWALACHRLLDQGSLEAGISALETVGKAFPEIIGVAAFRRIASMGVPGAAPLLPLAFKPGADLHILPRPGSDAAMVVFCDSEQRFTMPVVLAHRWFGSQPASVVYLRDLRGMLGAGGYPSLGPDRAVSVARLRAILDRLGARRIVTLGASGGVFPALHYGIALGASASLCFAGPTDLTGEFNRQLDPSREPIFEVIRAFPDYAVNLAPLLAGADPPMRVTLVHGESNRRDRAYAMRLAEGTRLRRLSLTDFSGHDVLYPFAFSGKLQESLEELLAPPA
jgi:hypothetical protein